VKLHDLRPAAGSHKRRTRVGRGIAAGQGKTAGRGTKGQKARAGASIPAWFEGGQTPIHVRVPKLRGFKNPFKIAYQVVNVGRIAEYAAAGRFGVEVSGADAPAAGKKAATKKSSAPLSVNPASLASAGLIGTDRKPVKVLGQGDVDQALFIAADAFTASARSKIAAAGGFVQLLAADGEPTPEAKAAPAEEAPAPEATSPVPATAAIEPEAAVRGESESAITAEIEAAEPEAAEQEAAEPAKRAPRKRKAAAATSEE
jgi:large subunit ribosomal protein L15